MHRQRNKLLLNARLNMSFDYKNKKSVCDLFNVNTLRSDAYSHIVFFAYFLES